MNIPLVDLNAQYSSIKDEIDSAIHYILDNSQFVMGAKLKNFEENFAKFCGVKHAICCANGTVAVELALKAAGIGNGDEVITVVNTFIATTEAITMTQAKPVFVDVDEKTFNMDPNKLEVLLQRKAAAGNLRVKAIVVVHLYGQPCEMDPIVKIAQKYNLKIIEDACQAHGSKYYGQNKKEPDGAALFQKIGSIGEVGCFSFYPGKNLGAYGDGGAIVTNNDDLASKMRMYSNHGRTQKYSHEFEGVNSRLDAMQAAVLNVKLNYLDEWTKQRRHNACLYTKRLSENIDSKVIQTPFSCDKMKHVYHLYVVKVVNREFVIGKLKLKGISTGIHYPIPLHLSQAYSHLDYSVGDFPIAEKVSKQILSLPMYPELNEEQIAYISDCLKETLKRG